MRISPSLHISIFIKWEIQSTKWKCALSPTFLEYLCCGRPELRSVSPLTDANQICNKLLPHREQQWLLSESIYSEEQKWAIELVYPMALQDKRNVYTALSWSTLLFMLHHPKRMKLESLTQWGYSGSIQSSHLDISKSMRWEVENTPIGVDWIMIPGLYPSLYPHPFPCNWVVLPTRGAMYFPSNFISILTIAKNGMEPGVVGCQFQA